MRSDGDRAAACASAVQRLHDHQWTLDALIEAAHGKLRVRVRALAPVVSLLHATVAGWTVSAARAAAWQNAKLLWRTRWAPALWSQFVDVLDGLATVAGNALLVAAA